MCESDPLPHVICSRCERTLNTLHGFRQAAHRAQELLKQFLANVAQAHSLTEVIIIIYYLYFIFIILK